MKTILALVLLGASQLCVATPLPEPGLLRVPRIYNALITTDAKLQPSRASPYSVPAVPVIGPPLEDIARVEILPTHHHATGRKSHHHHQQTESDDAEVPATDKEGKKLEPSSKVYPETFYPQSVGYYPHPFIPYSYPLAPQPYPFGQYSSAGVGGGPQTGGFINAGFGVPGFGAASGIGAAFGPFNSYPYGARGQPSDFSMQQSSSMHMTSGRRVVGGGDAGEEGLEEEEEADEDADAET